MQMKCNKFYSVTQILNYLISYNLKKTQDIAYTPMKKTICTIKKQIQILIDL